jgi:hypothetical protein
VPTPPKANNSQPRNNGPRRDNRNRNQGDREVNAAVPVAPVSMLVPVCEPCSARPARHSRPGARLEKGCSRHPPSFSASRLHVRRPLSTRTLSSLELKRNCTSSKRTPTAQNRKGPCRERSADMKPGSGEGRRVSSSGCKDDAVGRVLLLPSLEHPFSSRAPGRLCRAGRALHGSQTGTSVERGRRT